MTNNNGSNGNGSKFLTGLMWGALIGGGLVFLLGTKKGKRIIKMLSEEGLELSELLGEGEEDEVEEIIVPSKRVHTQKVVKHVAEEEQEENDSSINKQELEETPSTNGFKQTSTISKIASAPRRFFRGAPKR